VIRWIAIALALLAGILLLGYDQRTDDTGVEVALLIAVPLALTAAAPSAALAIALGVGLPIAASSVWNGNLAGVMSVLVALAGAYLGYVMRRESRRRGARRPA
jgi:predicted anti-sigma-YlaC factor YlaD